MAQPERPEVETDERGWIKVDGFLQTTEPIIWALSDATGQYMFRHTANYDAEMVGLNGFTDHRHQVDCHAVPHALYGYPQVGVLGLTEQQARDALYDILVGRARYMDVTNGYAIGEENGPAKVVVEQGTGKTLVCRIVRPHAALLVQQIVYPMNTGERDSMLRTDSQVIHPSLCEVVINPSANRALSGHVHVHQTRPVRQALAAMEGVRGRLAAQETQPGIAGSGAGGRGSLRQVPVTRREGVV